MPTQISYPFYSRFDGRPAPRADGDEFFPVTFHGTPFRGKNPLPVGKPCGDLVARIPSGLPGEVMMSWRWSVVLALFAFPALGSPAHAVPAAKVAQAALERARADID